MAFSVETFLQAYKTESRAWFENYRDNPLFALPRHSLAVIGVFALFALDIAHGNILTNSAMNVMNTIYLKAGVNLSDFNESWFTTPLTGMLITSIAYMASGVAVMNGESAVRATVSLIKPLKKI